MSEKVKTLLLLAFTAALAQEATFDLLEGISSHKVIAIEVGATVFSGLTALLVGIRGIFKA